MFAPLLLCLCRLYRYFRKQLKHMLFQEHLRWQEQIADDSLTGGFDRSGMLYLPHSWITEQRTKAGLQEYLLFFNRLPWSPQLSFKIWQLGLDSSLILAGSLQTNSLSFSFLFWVFWLYSLNGNLYLLKYCLYNAQTQVDFRNLTF